MNAMIKYILTGLLMTMSILAYSSVLSSQYKDSVVYQSEYLSISKVSAHVYLHTSFLQTQDFGKVPCNGMVVVDEKEAIVFDTPANQESTAELIRYLTLQMAVKIKGVVATHFHDDCVAGLNEFHKHQIPSYAENRTIRNLKAANSQFDMPKNGFDDFLELKAGDEKVSAAYFGEGHTKDNVIGYFAKEKIMFGGCLIKEIGAGKGYLGDANVNAWSATVTKVKQKHPQTNIVIPGHGKTGGLELLDYTIQLFN
ncbi:subclass B1 metallo-beta-lactamase [Pedobacter immunditicola]|uniref:subclass B1 metallo-beta-lactamase n=1 Tax=Pedobacter immunditicola TaxID=3133440 RepID=UPI0030B6D6F4